MSICYSRTAPSPRYRALLAQYERMHVEGEQYRQIPPAETFAGQSLPRHSSAIKALIDRYQARSVLDYGSGKGWQYRAVQVRLDDGRQFASIPAFWGVDRVVCYDPAYAPFSQLPHEQFDGVISTDVLEHCPEDDMPWIVDELFAFARRFVYANVACYPAMKRLANGENAHCTIRSTEWWDELVRAISARYPQVCYQFCLERVQVRADGQRELLADQLCG